jgi:polynucleotide 5'-kinase involved in rRNA processing
MKAETGIMVVGKSNIGKTTLCHLIANSKLKVVDNIGLAAIDL